MDDPATLEVPPNDTSSTSGRESSGFPAFIRITDLVWPAVAALLLTCWSAVSSTENLWTTVALLCGPPALLHVAVERVRQRRTLEPARRTRLLLTSPLVLLAASVAWWIALLVLTHGSATLAVVVLGPCLALAEVALGYAVPAGLLGYARLIAPRPWTGVVLGLVGLGLLGAWFLPMALEYGNLVAQGGPRPLQCSEVTATGVGARQWVAVAGGMIPPVVRPQARRDFPASVILGKVDHTDVALLDSGTGRWIDLRFDGLNNGPSYWGTLKETYPGILTATNDGPWGSDVPAELVQQMHGAPVGVLHVGAGPSTARSNALVSLAFLALVGWFTLDCVKKQRGQLRAGVSAGGAPNERVQRSRAT